jgi:hypothetical protein
MNRQEQVTAEDDLLSNVLVQRGSETGTPCVLTSALVMSGAACLSFCVI